MKKLLPLLLLLVSLSACGGGDASQAQDGGETGDDTVSITATSYPIYLFTSEVTKGVDDVTVTALVNQEVSCLHDYSLTVNDMKTLEATDILVINGADFDEFALDALEGMATQPTIINAGGDVTYLAGEAHDHDHDDAEDAHDHDDHDDCDDDDCDEEEHHHDHDSEFDPHYWMDPSRVAQMVNTIAAELSALDPENAETYAANAKTATDKLTAAQEDFSAQLEGLSSRDLITFHDGFHYFAESFGLNILVSIEEEEGQEASAKAIAEIISIVKEHSVPSIFTEDFSSDATAKAIAAETGVSIHSLSMLMAGSTENAGIDTYIEAMQHNIDVIKEGLK